MISNIKALSSLEARVFQLKDLIGITAVGSPERIALRNELYAISKAIYSIKELKKIKEIRAKRLQKWYPKSAASV